MADDYDANILLDSNEEGAKAKKSKDFIPKPRLLTSPAITLAAITGHSQPNIADDSQRQQQKEHSVNSDTTNSPKVGRKVDFIEPPTTDTETRTVLSNGTSNTSIQASQRTENGIMEKPAGVEPSNVHLVTNQSPTITETKLEDGTYKRLISHSVSFEGQVDDIEVASGNVQCLCRICRHPTIQKNWKVYVGSIILTILGLALVVWGLLLGLSAGFMQDLKSIIFLVGGLVLLLPGFYHLLFLSLAAYGVNGFKFSKLPSIK